jgi:hypothetical protein
VKCCALVLRPWPGWALQVVLPGRWPRNVSTPAAALPAVLGAVMPRAGCCLLLVSVMATRVMVALCSAVGCCAGLAGWPAALQMWAARLKEEDVAQPGACISRAPPVGLLCWW